jgi:AraC-like DNA-binding protein
MREYQVRICERLRVKFPEPTRHLRRSSLRILRPNQRKTIGDEPLCQRSRSDAPLRAQRLRISRSHLYAVLSEKGMTFAGILRERRLQAARAFLMTERFSEPRITDIALRCGYADTANFARAYGRRFGESPTASRAAF